MPATQLHAAPFAGHAAGLQRGRAAARRGARAAPMCAVKEIFMPALSSTMTEGKIVSWLKAPGDKVAKGESVVVVESDKADMDVESFSEGILGAIVIPEGGVANVGEPIAYVAETADDLEAAKSRGSGAGANGATAAPAAPTLPMVEVRGCLACLVGMPGTPRGREGWALPPSASALRHWHTPCLQRLPQVHLQSAPYVLWREAVQRQQLGLLRRVARRRRLSQSLRGLLRPPPHRPRLRQRQQRRRRRPRRPLRRPRLPSARTGASSRRRTRRSLPRTWASAWRRWLARGPTGGSRPQTSRR